ncbi:putative ABC transport system permease protein [Vibrio xiamenensis]|uniref:Putative ABC transport system permease protein n=1 Tax=Vibrio xiamenensis TaxID=861298 RepID=A0A1G7WMD8_9VIBR|nr:ABC transporter permease [Vibrio xiamenensis]SDG72400.1 putative ABC transport system permease protein [Vibrio xiamenensis]
MLWPVVKALLGHYRRYPFQILLVWLGLTLGVSVLVGVTAINHHARVSYEHGEKLFANPLPYRIRPKHSINKIPQGFYIQLRRDGFKECAPLELLRLRTQSGRDLQLVGIDPVAMIDLKKDTLLGNVPTLALMHAPYPVLISEDLAKYLSVTSNDYLELDDGRKLGPLLVDENDVVSGTQVIADLSLLRHMERSSGISVIACGEMSNQKLSALRSLLPNGMSLSRSSRAELESLTKAFHVNLSAMGMLAFLVGLFIFYQALSLSFIQRQPLVGSLRQLGVSGWQLAQALMLELMLLIIISWLCGNIFGLLLANQLIPAVSDSLNDLYNANVGLSINWSWSSSMYSLSMTILGSILACAWPLVRLLRTQPIRLSARLSLVRFAGIEFAIQALVACGLCVAAIAVYQAPKTQQSGFAIIGLMLLSAALFTPFLIWKIFNSLSFSLRWVKVRWFFADAASSMSYRGVATMGFMLAMAANIGVETMVGSFRDTTDKWLNQRLAADLYIYPNTSNAARMSDWLIKQPDVKSVWWRWEKEVTSNTGTMQVVSIGASQGELDALTVKIGIPDYWYHLHHSRGLMISESMAIKQGIRPGDKINLPGTLGESWLVVGVYYDYGNPYNQIMLSHRNWLYSYAGSGNVALGAVAKSGADVSNLKHRLESVFRLNSERLYDNSRIHKQAMRVFDRTFSIADTLGNITLVIAVFGIFFATLAGEISRQRHSALLRCLGMSGKELILAGCLQLCVFGAIAILIAMPLGIVLAKLVVDIIIKQSFGWTLELQFIPSSYLYTSILAMVSLVIAGAIPVIRLAKNTPIKLLRDAL